jgi:hypothetical protein
LFGLSQEGKEKLTELDDVSRDPPYNYGFTQLKKVLEMCVDVVRLPQKGLACTMFMRLDLSSKFTFLISMLGLVTTLVAEGMKKSQRVFSAIGSGIDGA